jgi:hypothetical protein
MSKVLGAAWEGGRHRTRLCGVLAVAAAAAAFVPWVSTESAQPRGKGNEQRGDKLLFFAADGLMQNRVESYASQVPGFRAAA